MAQQVLDLVQIRAAVELVCRKRMAQRVRRDLALNLGAIGIRLNDQP